MTASTQAGSSAPVEVRTERLRLVALDAELARKQAEDPDGFFALLGAQREAAWPPELFDAKTLHQQLSTSPDNQGWRAWVALMELSPGAPVRAVGLCGFQGPPDSIKGEVEMVYAMLPSFQEQGLATEMVDGLLRWAFCDARVNSARADTLPYLTSAQRVLEKTGFECVGERTPDGETVVRYRKMRPAA